MVLKMCSFYQAILLQSLPNKKMNMHTVSDEVLPGVTLILKDHIVTISHKDWDEDVLVSTANVRYATAAKELMMTFAKIEPILPQSKTPVVKRHRKNTK